MKQILLFSILLLMIAGCKKKDDSVTPVKTYSINVKVFVTPVDPWTDGDTMLLKRVMNTPTFIDSFGLSNSPLYWDKKDTLKFSANNFTSFFFTVYRRDGIFEDTRYHIEVTGDTAFVDDDTLIMYQYQF